jgi:putative MATE family efflux protein
MVEQTAAQPTDRRSLWRDVKEAVSGSQQDFTEGSLSRAITLLSIPMVLEMSMESLFGIVDVFFVSRLGANAVAAVGVTESLLTILFGVAIGVSMGTTAMVARRIGEKDDKGASVAAAQAIWIGVGVAAVIGVIGFFFTPQLFALMGASDDVIRVGAGYGQWMFAGNITIMLLFLNNAIFRGAGDAVIAMRALWISNGINIVLDPCLIVGIGPFPELGVTGAAIATNIGRGIGVLYQFYMLARGNSRIHIHKNNFHLDVEVLWRLIKVSIGGILQFLIATASWVGLVRIIALFGSAAIAGYTVALRIIVVTILPSWGMSNAAATLVGQNLGAHKPERAEKSVWVTGLWNASFLGLVSIVFIVFAEFLIGIFTDDPQVTHYGVNCLRYVSYGYIFYGYGMVMVQAFNGAGDTYTPTVINFFCYWLFQIPLAYALAVPLNLNASGAFLAITISESIITVVAILVFRRGKWKEQRI